MRQYSSQKRTVKEFCSQNKDLGEKLGGCIVVKTKPKEVEGNCDRAKKKESENREKRMKQETKVFAKTSVSSSQRAGSPQTQKDSYDRKRFFFWQNNTW